jgi:hypothetical protein
MHSSKEPFYLKLAIKDVPSEVGEKSKKKLRGMGLIRDEGYVLILRGCVSDRQSSLRTTP